MIRSLKYTVRGRLYLEWRCHGYVWQLIMTRARWRLVQDWSPGCPHSSHYWTREEFDEARRTAEEIRDRLHWQ